MSCTVAVFLKWNATDLLACSDVRDVGSVGLSEPYPCSVAQNVFSPAVPRSTPWSASMSISVGAVRRYSSKPAIVRHSTVLPSCPWSKSKKLSWKSSTAYGWSVVVYRNVYSSLTLVWLDVLAARLMEAKAPFRPLRVELCALYEDSATTSRSRVCPSGVVPTLL